jgi:uncharacterized protein (TIGR00297 family)
MMETLIIILIIIITGLTGNRLHSLSTSGSLAAVVTGTAVFAGFGVRGLIVLGVFFATSSLWSKYKSASKAALEEKLAKGSARDWRQVFANGGAAAVFSLLYIFQPNLFWLIGFSVCIASANSDTWASEIGPLSKKNPLLIRSFKRVEPGTSGAISLLGSVAATGGSLLIAVISTWFFSLPISYGMIIFLFGFIGNMIDTIIGAFYQQLYICSHCKIETEKRSHCGAKTIKIKGLSFVDNDMVNFISGLISAVAAICIIQL